MKILNLFKTKKVREAQSKLFRLINLTTELNFRATEVRDDQRCLRVLPWALTPERDGEFDLQETSFGISKDVSSLGFRMLFLVYPDAKRYLVSHILKHSGVFQNYHFVCEVVDVGRFAPNIHSAGMKVIESLENEKLPLDISAFYDAYRTQYFA